MCWVTKKRDLSLCCPCRILQPNRPGSRCPMDVGAASWRRKCDVDGGTRRRSFAFGDFLPATKRCRFVGLLWLWTHSSHTSIVQLLISQPVGVSGNQIACCTLLARRFNVSYLHFSCKHAGELATVRSLFHTRPQRHSGKPDKGDYSLAKAYSPVLLVAPLLTNNKTLESIVA